VSFEQYFADYNSVGIEFLDARMLALNSADWNCIPFSQINQKSPTGSRLKNPAPAISNAQCQTTGPG